MLQYVLVTRISVEKRNVNLKSRCSLIKSTLVGKPPPPKYRHYRKFSAKGHEVFEQEKSKSPWRRLWQWANRWGFPTNSLEFCWISQRICRIPASYSFWILLRISGFLRCLQRKNIKAKGNICHCKDSAYRFEKQRVLTVLPLPNPTNVSRSARHLIHARCKCPLQFQRKPPFSKLRVAFVLLSFSSLGLKLLFLLLWGLQLGGHFVTFHVRISRQKWWEG